MKYKFFIVSLLLLAACTRNVPTTPPSELSFQVASYLTRGPITGSIFPIDESFGAYAWADGTLSGYFMENERISFVEEQGLWKPSSTYYWPKQGTVDFVCYYPYGMNGIDISANNLRYTDIDVSTTQDDIMYADKAVGFNSRSDAVPVVFRHALALLKVDVCLSYNHKEEADGTITDWAVTLNSASLSGLYGKGNCDLVIADKTATGTVQWARPTDENGFCVWTNDGSQYSTPNLIPESGSQLATDSWTNVVPEVFVLPQALLSNQQTVNLNITVSTVRNGVPFLRETINVSAPLYSEPIQAWQMNQALEYRIKISPTASHGNGGNPGSDVDPANPNLNDVVVTFDPSVSSWDIVDVTAILI